MKPDQQESTAAQMHEIPVALAHAYRDLEKAARDVSRVLGPTPILDAALRKVDEARRG